MRVVDDGSEDDTAAIVARMARDDARVTLQREPHRGKGGAVRAGMLAARGELCFLCDADLSMPLHELSRFLDNVPRECDIAIGTREGETARPRRRAVLPSRDGARVQRAGAEERPAGHSRYAMWLQDVHRPRRASMFSASTIDGWAFDIEALVDRPHAGLAHPRSADRMALRHGFAGRVPCAIPIACSATLDDPREHPPRPVSLEPATARLTYFLTGP